MESLGQLKTKSRSEYPKFTAVREAAAEANACTSAEIKRSLPRSSQRIFPTRELSSRKLFSFRINLMKNIEKLSFSTAKNLSAIDYFSINLSSCYVEKYKAILGIKKRNNNL